MRKLLASSLFGFSLVAGQSTWAQEVLPDGRIAVDAGGCKLSFPNEPRNRQFAREAKALWIGPCINGFAEGPGILLYEGLETSRVAEQATLRRGIHLQLAERYIKYPKSLIRALPGRDTNAISAAEVPEWAKFVLGTFGAKMTDSEIQSARAFLAPPAAPLPAPQSSSATQSSQASQSAVASSSGLYLYGIMSVGGFFMVVAAPNTQAAMQVVRSRRRLDPRETILMTGQDGDCSRAGWVAMVVSGEGSTFPGRADFACEKAKKETAAQAAILSCRRDTTYCNSQGNLTGWRIIHFHWDGQKSGLIYESLMGLSVPGEDCIGYSQNPMHHNCPSWLVALGAGVAPGRVPRVDPTVDINALNQGPAPASLPSGGGAGSARPMRGAQ